MAAWGVVTMGEGTRDTDVGGVPGSGVVRVLLHTQAGVAGGWPPAAA